MATWNACTGICNDRLPELLRIRVLRVDLGKSLQAEREKLTCSGSRSCPGTPRGEGEGASLNFGVVAWTAVGAAAEEDEADPEASGGVSHTH